MKLIVLTLSALTVFALSGPVAVTTTPMEESLTAVPSWLNLPDHEFVNHIEYTGFGPLRDKQGIVLLELPSDGHSEFAWVSENYRNKGFLVSREMRGLDSYMESPDVLTALDPATGRKITATLVTKSDGSLLRLSFMDPSNQFTTGGN